MTAGPSGSLLDNMREGVDGTPVVSPPDLTDRHSIDGRRVRRLPHHDAQKLGRFALEEGDLLMVRQGTLGRLALMGPDNVGWLYGSSLLRIRPRREHVLPTYLIRYLSSPSARVVLLGKAQPGTVPSLNSAALNDLPVVLPPLPRQQMIVEALADVEDQIEIQRKIMQRLEVLKPSLLEELISG